MYVYMAYASYTAIVNHLNNYSPEQHLFLIFTASSSLMRESVGIYDVSYTLCVLKVWEGVAWEKNLAKIEN